MDESLSKQNLSLIKAIVADMMDRPASSMTVAIERVLQQCTAYLGVERGYLILLSAAGEHLEASYVWPAAAQHRLGSEVAPGQPLPALLPGCRAALTAQGRLVIPQVQAMAADQQPEQGRLLEQGIQSLLAFALGKHGQTIGFIGFDAFAQPQQWAPTTLEIMALLADIISSAIFRWRSEAAMRKSEQRFRAVFDNALDGILLAETSSHRFLDANARMCQMLGYTHDELTGLTVVDIHPSQEMDWILAQFERQVNGENLMAQGIPVLRKDGRVFYADVSASLFEQNGQAYLIGLFRDITERKQAQENLQLAANVFTYAREGIVITEPDGTIIDVNAAFTQITGYTKPEVVGQNPRILKSDRHSPAFYAALWQQLTETGHWTGEVWNRRKNGELYAEMLTISAVHDDQGHVQHYVAVFSDITEKKQHQERLEHIAHFDALTGLPNRVLLADRLSQAIRQARRQKRLLAVVYLDLDGFKAINDSYGHDVGDQLLMVIASRMRAAMREQDTIARLGGDEFVALLTDLSSTEVIEPLLKRLAEAAASPLFIGNLGLQVSASLGVAFYPQEQEEVSASQLLRQADQAMYQAKMSGKNRYQFLSGDGYR